LKAEAEKISKTLLMMIVERKARCEAEWEKQQQHRQEQATAAAAAASQQHQHRQRTNEENSGDAVFDLPILLLPVARKREGRPVPWGS
jgi:sRNA-binding protein